MGNCLSNLFPFQIFRKGTAKRLTSLPKPFDSSLRKDLESAAIATDDVDRADLAVADTAIIGESGVWKGPGIRGLGLLVSDDFTKSIRDANLINNNSYNNSLERIEYSDQCLLPLLRPQEKIKDAVEEFFVPLTEEEEGLVAHAFSNFNRRKVLVSHNNSGIDITGDILQCLRIGAWLNDEVINLYFALLKEREQREPQKYLKCHFFNTFFYKKLICGGDGYNFQAVRRWTVERKLGYHLLDCDKIFVPIHKEVHWCLAIINKKDKRFQYLDSLKGVDNQVLHVLARYYVDEVKDKSGEDIDVSSWDKEYVTNLPNQGNGSDCGMFMIKYADFHSRNIGLCFDQGDMPYFRQRTAKEILNLKAE